MNMDSNLITEFCILTSAANSFDSGSILESVAQTKRGTAPTPWSGKDNSSTWRVGFGHNLLDILGKVTCEPFWLLKKYLKKGTCY